MNLNKISDFRLGVSVVIVTYNGGERIKTTLQHLAKQKGSDLEWEVLLVDNNSTDNTSRIAHDFWKNTGSNRLLRIVTELQPGTMYARRRGIEEAKYRYILFCDDDNWLADNYIETAFHIINQNDKIAAVGGMGELHFEQTFLPPGWINQFERNYGAGPQGYEDGDVTHQKGCLYSAGAIFDVLWIKRLYKTGFRSSLKGRSGNILLAGEDTELTLALKLIGGELHYSSSMQFRHFMPERRMNWRYLKKMWRAFGYADYILSPYTNLFYPRSKKNTIQRFWSNIFELFYLYVVAFYRNIGEGHTTPLRIERKKGELKAMFFDRKRYVGNKKLVDELSRKSSKLLLDDKSLK